MEESLEINPRKGGNKSARFRFETNLSPDEGELLSVLSVPLKKPFAETSSYPLDGASLHDDYQERLAIAEYDGLQTASQAECIAYLDAFMAVLATLADEGLEGDWLSRKIVTVKKWHLD